MEYNDLVDRLIEQGKDANDFNIEVTENGYSITPKWFYEQKQIAKKEDVKVKKDVASNSALSNLENMQLAQNIKDELKADQAQANLELMMLIQNTGGK